MHPRLSPYILYIECVLPYCRNEIAPRQRLQTYYGYAFESYCTSSAPRRPANVTSGVRGWGGDVDTNVQWCSVVKTKLGDTRIIIGGEVDCVRGKLGDVLAAERRECLHAETGEYTGSPDAFVELKTSLSIRGTQDEARFEK